MTTAQIALRNCFRYRARSLITISAIAFGATALIFVGGFFEDMFYKMRESYIKGHTGHLQVYKRGFFEHGSGKPFNYLIEHPQELVPLIRGLDGVKSVMSRVEFSGLISTGESTVACLAQGIEPQQEPTIRAADTTGPRKDLPSLGGSVIAAGEPLRADDAYGVLLGKGLAGGLGVTPGDGLILVGNTVGGSINAYDVTVRGIFFTSSKVFDDHAMRLPLATAQRLLHTEAVQSLVIMLHRTPDTARVRQALERLFAERHLDLEVKDWSDLTDFYAKTRLLFGRMFFILKLVIAIIVILSIYNTMNMAVLERTTEIGTLMALGTKRSGIWRLFLYEGAALGLVGGLVGLVTGTLLTLVVRHVGIPMPPPPGATMTWISEPMIVPSVLGFTLVLAVLTALLSSVCPAYKASKLEIAQALRYV